MDHQKQEITAAVGRRIRQIRLSRAISQEELAFRANLNPAYFGQVERGEKCPTIDTLFKIANALNIPLPELLQTEPFYVGPTSHEQSIAELLTRIPSDKKGRVLEIVEGIIDLLWLFF